MFFLLNVLIVLATYTTITNVAFISSTEESSAIHLFFTMLSRKNFFQSSPERNNRIFLLDSMLTMALVCSRWNFS